MTSRITWILGALLVLAYPGVVYFSLHYFDPHWILIPVLVLLWLRWRHLSSGWPIVTLLAVLGLLLYWERTLSVFLYPVLVNAVFLLWFLVSLFWFPPPVVERLARLVDPNLPPEGVCYTRRLTWVWCLFFGINGSIAAITVWLDDLALWALYNGLISYILMGMLMAGEYWLRRRLMRLNGHA